MTNRKCCGVLMLCAGILAPAIQLVSGYGNFENPVGSADSAEPVLMKFTFWNVENPDEVEMGAIPKVTEKGPYVYEETRYYHYVKNDSQHGWYSIYKQWDYRADFSCENCSKDDEVTILNMPLIAAVGIAQSLGGLMESAVLGSLNKAMNGEHVHGLEDGCCNDTLFVTKGVDDLLFGGVRDGIVRFLLEYSMTNDPNLLPPQIQMDGNGFAIMNPKNGTTDNEWYQVETDTKLIVKWGPKSDDMHANLEFTGWWPVEGYKDREDSCTQIKGTHGQQFPLSMLQDKLWVFSTDICRSTSFVFEKEVDLAGIKAHRFTTSAESQWVNRTDNFCLYDELGELYLGNDTYDPCINETDDPDVLDIKDCNIEMDGRNGLLDLHNCYESPMVVSNPHFYQAEQELLNIATGMNPDPELHETQIDVDPNTGTTLRMHRRIQFNMPLLRNAQVDVLNNVYPMMPMFPLLWVDEGFDSSPPKPTTTTLPITTTTTSTTSPPSITPTTNGATSTPTTNGSSSTTESPPITPTTTGSTSITPTTTIPSNTTTSGVISQLPSSLIIIILAFLLNKYN